MLALVEYGMFAKGYRYRLTPTDRSFKPLFVKTADQAGPLMREMYPTKKFSVDKLARLKAGRTLGGSFFGPGTLLIVKARFGEEMFDVTAYMPNGRECMSVLPTADLEM